MKQLWILNHYANTPAGAGGTRHYGLARHLAGLGWQTSIVAASVEHETGRQRLADRDDVRCEDVDGITFLWVRSPSYRGNGSGRVRNMIAYSTRVLRPRSTRDLPRPDVIIGSSVHPFAAASGAWLARRFGVPFVFEVRDLWPQTLIDMGRLQARRPSTWAFGLLERWLYRRADRIITVLPHAGEYMERLGVPTSKIRWIPNGVELEGYPEPESVKSTGVFSLMYLGAHGQANDLETIVRAMALLKGRPEASHIRLTMVGNGPLKASLVALAKQLGADNIAFREPVPKAQVPDLTATADAFVLSVLDRPNLYRYGISMNKLFDYFAAGRPVVMSCDAVGNPLALAEAGFVVAPEDPSALAAAILRMAALSVAERVAMGCAGREYVVANHGYRQLATKLAMTLDELLHTNGQ